MASKKDKELDSEVTRVYLQNRQRLIAWVRRFVKRPEDVEDIVQEAYIRSYQNLLGKKIDNTRAYLFSAARNLAFKHNNLSFNRLSDQLDDLGLSEVIDIEDPVADCVEAREEFAHLCEAIRELPQQCRRVFVLKKIYGLSHQEIADRMELSVNTVHQHLAKGVARCALYMRDKGYARSRTSSKSTRSG